MRKFLFLLAIIFPIFSTGISVRIAFNEWIIDYIYAQKDFPKDKWGLPESFRKKLAKIGLKAVLSDKGFEEFRKATLPNGRPAFTKKEIDHMKDVKDFLKKFFPFVYLVGFLWLLGLFISRSPSYLILSGIVGISTLGILALLTFTNYNKAFELFHIITFDPYSWKFRYTDTLLRIYPMKFWYEATKLVAIIAFTINFFTLILGVLGYLFKKK